MASIFHAAIRAKQRVFLPGNDVGLTRRNDEVTAGAAVFLLSVLLADGLNDKAVPTFGFYPANTCSDTVKIQLVWLLVFVPVAATRHINTNFSAGNDPTPHTGFRSEQKCSQGPIESGFLDLSPSHRRPKPFWIQAVLVGCRTRHCFCFEQSGSSPTPSSTTRRGIGIRTLAGRWRPISHGQLPVQFQDLVFR